MKIKSFHSLYNPYLIDLTPQFKKYFKEVTGREMVINLVDGGMHGATLVDERKIVFMSLNSMGSMTTSPVPSIASKVTTFYNLHDTVNLIQAMTGLEVLKPIKFFAFSEE